MTDQEARIAITSIVIIIYAVLFQGLLSYQARRRRESGRRTGERAGYVLGRLWARRYGTTHQSLHRSRVHDTAAGQSGRDAAVDQLAAEKRS